MKNQKCGFDSSERMDLPATLRFESTGTGIKSFSMNFMTSAGSPLLRMNPARYETQKDQDRCIVKWSKSRVGNG